VDGEGVFEHALAPEAARQGWWTGQVDLGAWAAREVRLTLATTPGPTGDVTGDWAGWGKPQIQHPQAEAYREKVGGRPWLLEWKKAEVKAELIKKWKTAWRRDGKRGRREAA